MKELGALKTNHGGESQIQYTLLLRLCDSVARLCLILRTSVRKANLFSYILRIQNIFVLLNISSIKGFMIYKAYMRFQCMRSFYFSLTWGRND